MGAGEDKDKGIKVSACPAIYVRSINSWYLVECLAEKSFKNFVEDTDFTDYLIIDLRLQKKLWTNNITSG